MTNTKQNSVFQDFTRKYALSKTLRFRLIPTPKTEELLKQNRIVPKDKEIYEAYLGVKTLFDELHRDFIKESLDSFSSKYFSEIYEEWKKWKRASDTVEKRGLDERLRGRFGKGGSYGDLRLGIVTRFSETAKQWAEQVYPNIVFKKRDPGILSEKNILEVLKLKFQEPEQVEMIEKFNRFFGYLSGFIQSRENLYSIGSESTALAYRMIDVNLERYFANAYAVEVLNTTCPDLALSADEQDFSNPTLYPKALLQDGIEKYNETAGILNKKINEYRQSHPDRSPAFLLTLRNQILGKRERNLFLDEIESDEELVSRLKTLYSEAETELLDTSKETRILSLKKIVRNILENETAQGNVYLSKVALNTLFHKYLTDDGINALLGSGGLGNKRKKSEQSDEEYSLPKAVSIADFRHAMKNETLQNVILWKDYVIEEAKKYGDISNKESAGITDNCRIFSGMLSRQFDDSENGYEDVISKKRVLGHLETTDNISTALQSGGIRVGAERELDVMVIKEYLDSLLRYHRMARYFTSKDIDKLDRDQGFYSVLDDYFNEYSLGSAYDAIRNYLTKKPWSEEKLLLTFDQGRLLHGFMESPEGNSQYKGYILRKNEEWYLGVSDYSGFLDHTTHERDLGCRDGEDCYEKMEYFQLNWGKNIAGGRVYESYTKKSFGSSIGYQEHKQKLTSKEHVSFLKDLIRDRYARKYEVLSEYLSKEYVDVAAMQHAFEELNIKGIRFRKIKAEQVDSQVMNKGKRKYNLYMFKIINKDLHPESKNGSISNIHTLYWKNLFSEKNNREMAIDLGADAKIFFRAKTECLEKKRVDKKGESRDVSPRFLNDTYLFHVPVVLNANIVRGRLKNDEFNAVVAENIEQISVLGLDRGEKHLVYYSLLGPDGELKETGSFNEIQENGKEKMTNYLEKLEVREKERKASREDWKTIGTIKELKNGYVSQVVRNVADLVLRNNAIIVLEDLNTGFKRGRQKIERQVYQKFELALAKKLNYLVNKTELNPETPGHPVRGLQLTPLVSNYQDIEGKSQVGIMLYTRAGYTSTTCPDCGWRRKPGMWEMYANEKQARKYLERLSIVKGDAGYCISHKGNHETKKNKNGEVYESHFGPERLITNGANRFVWKKRGEVGSYEKVCITEKLEKLFHEAGFDMASGRDLSVDVLSRNEGALGSDFYKGLFSLINLLTRMRYTEAKSGVNSDGGRDIIHCPACGFRSDENSFYGHDWNGDANGAYNIARKGRMMLERIVDFERRKREGDLEKGEKYPKLFISDSEWDDFARKNALIEKE